MVCGCIYSSCEIIVTLPYTTAHPGKGQMEVLHDLIIYIVSPKGCEALVCANIGI